MMAWWHNKVVFPVKRIWLAAAARIKARKDGSGILKLHDDVQTCGYQDVQVMWEILRSEMELSSNPKQRRRWLFSRRSTWSIRSTPSAVQ